MGSLYLRGKTWWMKYYVNGKPVQASTKTSKKMIAKEVLKDAERKADEGKIPGHIPLDSPFEGLVKLYFLDYQINGRKSMRRAESCVKHLREAFSNSKANEITSKQIQDYITGRLESACCACKMRFIGPESCPVCAASDIERGAANATVNRELSALKRMFTLGADQTPPLVIRPPKITMLKERNTRTGFFEHWEHEAVHAALPPHLQPVATFGYKSGWRLGEILSLTWDQVDRANGCVRIDDSKNSDARTFYFDSELVGVFTRIWADRKRARRFKDHVFLNASGTDRMWRFDKAWKTACKKAGVDRIFHDYRRTAVRNMVRSGTPENVAMKITGHRTRAVFDRYNIVNEQDLKKAAARQEAYLEDQNTVVTNLATLRNSKAKAV